MHVQRFQHLYRVRLLPPRMTRREGRAIHRTDPSELEADLLQRRTQAEAKGWIGEIEGIDLTLTFLRAKRDETQRRAQRPAVHLGIPARRRPQESE
ncbi:hypothetical protein ACFZAG_36260 [Streptomyces sp. NPDC012403]|uniref:hypothetical protein n=1 Tax=unclassified Streptomyces TaxID=2593676 RepID=UPI0020B88C20|nr:hypothetical protein [Streptomyces sp. AC558_RSS880]